jgi:hypothetical protein
MPDHHFYNKVRAIIALRDRGATQGEKDAAQNRLVLILARHKLTESDIPPDPFSSSRPRFRPPPSWTTSPNWRKEGRRARAQSRPRPESPRKGKLQPRQRFEKALGKHVTDLQWRRIKRAQRLSAAQRDLSNPAAYQRAFYEAFAYTMRARIENHTDYYARKSKNTFGLQDGREAAEAITVDFFNE